MGNYLGRRPARGGALGVANRRAGRVTWSDIVRQYQPIVNPPDDDPGVGIADVRRPYTPLQPRPTQPSTDRFREIERQIPGRTRPRTRNRTADDRQRFRDIERQVEQPAPRTTSPAATSTRSTTTTSSTTPRTTARRRPRPRTTAPDRPVPAAPAPPGVADDPYFSEDPATGINTVYRAAYRSLEEERRRAAEDYAARQKDLNAFNQWVETGRLASQNALTEQQNQARAAYQDMMSQSQQRMQSYVDAARVRNPDVVQQEGTGAVFQQAAADVPADQANLLTNQQIERNWQTRADAERGINNATAANMAALALGGYNTRLQDTADAQTELDTSRARDILGAQTAQREARLAAQQADRQYALDQQAAEYLRRKGEVELGLQQYNAETERLKVTTAAQLNAELNKIKNDYNNRRISQADADRQARLLIADARLQSTAKDRALRRWQTVVRARTGTGAQGDPSERRQVASDLSRYVNTQAEAYDAPFSQIDRHNQGQIARNAASYLRSIAPDMTVEDATLLLGSAVGRDILRDPEFVNDVLFRLFR